MSNVSSEVKEIEVSAVVLKCTCGKPKTHKGEVCPQAKAQDKGIVAHLKQPSLIKKFLGG